MDRTKYFNQLLYRMEELFYHELSDCAPWKTEYVGIDLVQAGNISGKNEDEIITACIKTIKEAGLVQDISYKISGQGIRLRLKVEGCQHMLKETLIRKSGIKPYNCPIANMILDQLIEKLGYTTTYVAELEVDEPGDRCQLQAAIYATPDRIGQVSDWRREKD